MQSSVASCAAKFGLGLLAALALAGCGGGGGGGKSPDVIVKRTVGGTVSGLTGTLVLQNNGGDNLSVAANGAFSFATTLASGAAYAVTVLTQPTGMACTVTNGSGTIASANVTNVAVACVPITHTVGGTVSGLTGTLVLQNNGGDNLSVAANGAFSFATMLASGATYAVTVLTQPAGMTCTVTNGSGTIAAANVSNIAVGCLPNAPALTLTPQRTKILYFSWADVGGESEYRLLENPDGTSGYSPVATIPADSTSHDLIVSLPARINASYQLEACNATGCTASAPIQVGSSLAAAVGYVKASNTEARDVFGYSLALSADGNTLAVGAVGEASNATGLNGDQTNNAADGSGAVYVYARSAGSWTQQAYIKASNTEASDLFGYSLALSADGNTLAVGASNEDSNATGLNGDQTNNDAMDSGAAYVYTRNNAGAWTQQAYVKASNTGARDLFGMNLALSADGNTLAVGASSEASNATGLNGDQTNNAADGSGAVYVYARSAGSWTQQAYIKASNTEASDLFGYSLALSADGNTLAVGASNEDSNATGINGDQANNAAAQSGAAYVYTRSAGIWSQQAYVKASNTGGGDVFGISLALSADGNTLAVGSGEASNATGINSDQTNNAALGSGAVYLY